MKWIEEKMRLLGVASHPDYRIAFYLDIHAMISVHTPKYGLTQVSISSLYFCDFIEIPVPCDHILLTFSILIRFSDATAQNYKCLGSKEFSLVKCILYFV